MGKFPLCGTGSEPFAPAAPRRHGGSLFYTQISVFHHLEKRVQSAFHDLVSAKFGLEADIVIEQPKQPSFGELALPVAFQLAKSLRQPPRKVASDLVTAAPQ